MTFPDDDLERIRDDYTRGETATSLEQFRDDLDAAGFDGASLEAAAEGLAAKEDVAISEQARLEAQRQAVESLGSGGAVASELVRAEGGKTIGSPSNVSQRIERTGPTTGDVIAVNQNTGTEGKIGEVELANPASAIE